LADGYDFPCSDDAAKLEIAQVTEGLALLQISIANHPVISVYGSRVEKRSAAQRLSGLTALPFSKMSYCVIDEQLTRYVSKQFAKRLLAKGSHEKISNKVLRWIAPGSRRQALQVISDPFADYDYPENPFHPELQHIPAYRYPILLAPRR